MYAALAELETNTGVFNSQILVDELAALKRRIHSEIEAMQSKIAFKNEPTESEIPNNDGKSIEVKVRFLPGNEVKFKIDVNSTVYDLKSKIEERLCFSPGGRALRFGTKTLEDGHTLNDYNITDGSVLEMAIFD